MLPNIINRKNLIFVSIFALFYVVCSIAFTYIGAFSAIASYGVYALFAAGVIFIWVRRRLELDFFDMSRIALGLYMCANSIFYNLSGTDSTLYKYLICIVVIVIFSNIIAESCDIIDWIWAAIIVGGVIFCVEIIKYYGGINNLVEASKNTDVRTGEELGNVNHIGYFLANGFLCCLMILFKRYRGPVNYIKLIVIPIAIAFCAIALLTRSKKTLLFIGASVLIVGFLYSRKLPFKFKMLIFVLAVVAVAILTYLVFNVPLFSGIKERLISFYNTLIGKGKMSESDKFRMEMIETGFREFLNKPIFGNGAGYSFELFGTYAHNNFIELLMNWGLVGFILYYAPYPVLLISLYKFIKQKDSYAIYFSVFVLVDLIISIGTVNYNIRITQIVLACAFQYATQKNNMFEYENFLLRRFWGKR